MNPRSRGAIREEPAGISRRRVAQSEAFSVAKCGSAESEIAVILSPKLAATYFRNSFWQTDADAEDESMGVNLNASLSLSPSVPLLPSSLIMFYANHSTATEAMSFISCSASAAQEQRDFNFLFLTSS